MEMKHSNILLLIFLVLNQVYNTNLYIKISEKIKINPLDIKVLIVEESSQHA